MIEQGFARVGEQVARSKSTLVFDTVQRFLADRPKLGKLVPKLKLYRYEVTKAPFVILYDFTDDEIRIHEIVHARSDIPNTDLSTVEW